MGVLVEGNSPVGILALGGGAEPTADTHARKAGVGDVGIVGRTVLPIAAYAAGRALSLIHISVGSTSNSTRSAMA